MRVKAKDFIAAALAGKYTRKRRIQVDIQESDLEDEIFEGWVMEHGDPFIINKTATVTIYEIEIDGNEIHGTAEWAMGEKPTTIFSFVNGKFSFDFEDLEDDD